MLSTLILLTCLGQLQPGGSTELELPKPHYHQLPGDPPWLVQTVQFHGHLGPSVIAGRVLAWPDFAGSGHTAISMSKSPVKARLPRRRSHASWMGFRLRLGLLSASGRSIGFRPIKSWYE